MEPGDQVSKPTGLGFTTDSPRIDYEAPESSGGSAFNRMADMMFDEIIDTVIKSSLISPLNCTLI
jgi:hypothetical protein